MSWVRTKRVRLAIESLVQGSIDRWEGELEQLPRLIAADLAPWLLSRGLTLEPAPRRPVPAAKPAEAARRRAAKLPPVRSRVATAAGDVHRDRERRRQAKTGQPRRQVAGKAAPVYPCPKGRKGKA